MNQKSNKGITLIALVITIIVLLILAGVTLNIVLGDDGIIERTKQSGETYKEKEDEEVIKLAYTALKTDKLGNKIEEITADGIKEELEKTYEEGNVEVNNSLVVTTEGNKKYKINADGSVTKIDASVETFEFELLGKIYTAEEGMTLEEWIFSDYNKDYYNDRYSYPVTSCVAVFDGSEWIELTFFCSDTDECVGDQFSDPDWSVKQYCGCGKQIALSQWMSWSR